jgi:hypothetical protein
VTTSVRLAIGISLLGVASCLAASAQEPATPAEPTTPEPAATAEPTPAPETPEPAGSVAGTVYCTDTNMPARLAEVVLVPASGGSAEARLTGTTDLEGRFSIGKVPEGRYFAVANYAGYLNPLGNANQADLDPLDAEARKHFESRLTSVTVSSKLSAPVSIRLERAAEIDGTVQYDDGSPAIGLRLSVKTKSEQNASATADPGLAAFAPDSGESSRSTDDHGRFRLVGLAPGEYFVSVSVPTMSSEMTAGHSLADIVASSPGGGALTVFVGGALRASKAKPIKLGTGEAMTDANITIPLSTLHTIRGRVVLKSNGAEPPAAALELLYADTGEVARVALAAGGDFAIGYVAEGSYILRAAANSEPLPAVNVNADGGVDIAPGAGSTITANQESAAEMPVMVTREVSGVTIAVPDPPAAKAEPSPSPAETNPPSPQ